MRPDNAYLFFLLKTIIPPLSGMFYSSMWKKTGHRGLGIHDHVDAIEMYRGSSIGNDEPLLKRS